jgi:hypothetical protein
MTPLQGLVWIAQGPQLPSYIRTAPHSTPTVVLGIGEGDPLREVGVCRYHFPQIIQDDAERMVGGSEEGGVLEALGQGQGLLTILSCRL